ncbi:hypothetical protein V2O64_14940 [Verrucomicrobiaceae bacterium 227]
MNLKLNFEASEIGGLVLAKVGNPSRDEPLQTSKQLFKVEEEDQAMLCPIFLKPFRSLTGHRFTHHSSLDKNEVNASAAAIFADQNQLLEQGCEIAKRLYSKSTHPNIKSGDLCISMINMIEVDGEMKRAICILKSESVTPFLSISAHEGDLQLSTEQGINPEKIDKGCLILEHLERKGFYVLTFDRAGSESRFWIRDFLGVRPIPDSALLSKRVAEMAVAAVTPEFSKATDSPPWDANEPAQDALTYLGDQKNFSLQEFEEHALRTDAAKSRFAEEKKRVEEEEGIVFEENFDISKRDVSKAKKLMKSIMKLDTGVEIRLRPKVIDKPGDVLERGFDEEKKMNFIKVYYNEDLA